MANTNTELAWLRYEKKCKVEYRESILDEITAANDGRFADKIQAMMDDADRLQSLADKRRAKAIKLQQKLERLKTADGVADVRAKASVLSAEIQVLRFLISQPKTVRRIADVRLEQFNKRHQRKTLRWIARFAKATKEEANRMIEGLLGVTMHK